MEKMWEALERVIYVLLNVWEGFLDYFRSWLRGDILTLLFGLLALLLAILVPIWLHRRQRAITIVESFRKVYQVVQVPKIDLTHDAKKKEEKRLFYEGRSKKTALENAASGFAAEREKFLEIIDAVLKHPRKSSLHIEVVGDRKQGKSTLLAQLSLYFAGLNTYTVVMPFESSDQTFDWNLLESYRRITVPGWYYRILGSRTNHKFVIVIDDFLTPKEEALTPKKALFLNQILRLEAPVILITSSPSEIGSESSRKFDLSLTPQDEENILHKLRNDLPILIPTSLTINLVRGSAGGYRIYKNELMAFMSLLLREAAEKNADLAEGIREFNLELTDANKDALKYIAACQVIDVEIPPEVLRFILPQLDHDILLASAEGWIRYVPLSYSPKVKGYSLVSCN